MICFTGGVDTKVTLLNQDGKECTNAPCDLVQGSINTIQVDFISPTDSNGLKAQAQGNIAGLNINWPGFDRDACKDKGIQCPVKLNQELSYKLKFEVKKVYPRISTTVTFKLASDSKKEIFCFKFPVKIVAKQLMAA